jgi:hypothetical protein
MLFELGTVTGDNFRHRDHPGGFLAELSKNQDAIDFLRSQPDFQHTSNPRPPISAMGTASMRCQPISVE